MADEQQGGGTLEMISPQDYRVYSVPSAQAEAYKRAGYVTTDPNINRPQIEEHFSGVTGAGHSFLISTLAGVPFAKSLIAGASTPEQAKAWQESFDAAHREHPVLDFLGRATGTVGAVAGVAATGGALAGALGGGAAAAGAGAAAAGEGALAAEGAGLAGAGLAGEAGIGAAAAEGAGAATGLGADAAAGAARGVSSAVNSLGGSSVLGVAAKGAATNMALGHIARIDDSALAHAADPFGKEKIQWALNSDDLLDAAIGAALPVTLGTGAKALQYIGKNLNTGGMKLMQSAITNASKMEEVERQGRIGDVRAKLEEVLKAGRKDPASYVKVRVKDAGNVMEDLKSELAHPELDYNSTSQLKQAMKQAFGKNNRIYKRLDEFWKKPVWDVKDMQDINAKIYKEIEFSEPGLRPDADKRYLQAAEAVKNGMMKVFQNNDPSIDGMASQKWTTALKEYSDWMLTKSVMKRGQGPKGVADILNSMGSGAASGFLVGSLFGSFGGPMASMANNAAYQGVRTINAYHYGRAAQAMGAVMNWANKGLTNVVEAGLYGVPQIVTSGVRPYFTKDEYQQTASKVSAARNDPLESFTNIHKAMTDKQIPDHIADDAAQAAHAQVQFLGSKLPSRMTAPDVATLTQMDPVQQRRFMGQVKTMQDPTYGLAYPTSANMEVLQRFYPNTLAAAQQAILSQLQRNPTLPSQSKQWASRVLGRPMNNLSSPSFSSMLQQARQAKAQADAQGQQRMATRSRKTTGGDAEGTRLDQLQGGSQ